MLGWFCIVEVVVCVVMEVKHHLFGTSGGNIVVVVNVLAGTNRNSNKGSRHAAVITNQHNNQTKLVTTTINAINAITTTTNAITTSVTTPVTTTIATHTTEDDISGIGSIV